MTTKCVNVFDRSGVKLFSYSVALDEEGCLDDEFEEMALILAESSGLVAAGDIAHFTACCDRTPILDMAVEQASDEPSRPPRGQSRVVSLVKHRMKRAGYVSARHRLRQSY